MKRALIVPDMHVGFRRQPSGLLDPLHDATALQATLDCAAAVKPHDVILLGDNLDLAAFSLKFPATSDLKETTQASLAALRDWLVKLRLAIGPRANIIYLEGNHEARIHKALSQAVPEAVSLTPVGGTHPALSVPSLLRLDEPDIDATYVGPYGVSYWLWGIVDCSHGDLIRKNGGATVGARLQSRPWHQVFGHIHRAEMAGRTMTGPEGPYTVWAMSPGTLARLDGIVPAHSPANDWQQGLGLIQLDARKEVTFALLPIVGGRVRVRWDSK